LLLLLTTTFHDTRVSVIVVATAAASGLPSRGVGRF
jgi:hypothetical protein